MGKTSLIAIRVRVQVVEFEKLYKIPIFKIFLGFNESDSILPYVVFARDYQLQFAMEREQL